MWEHTYTQQQLEQSDTAMFRIMRATQIQDVVDTLIPDQPPKNKFEYEMAAKVFVRRILTAQPNMTNPNASPEEAYKVENQLYPPLVLLGHHARTAILNIALENDDNNGLGFIVSMQETACQFHNDEILTSAGKLGFAILAFLITNKNKAEVLDQAAITAQIPLIKKGESCGRNHSSSAIRLCTNLYGIISNLSVMNGGDKKHPQTDMSRAAVHIYINQFADDIDKTTNSKFRMKEWVNDTIKRLGYNTGVR